MIFLAFQALELRGSGLAIDTNAYAAIFLTIHAFFLALVGAALIMNLVVLHRLRTGDYDWPLQTSVQVAALWWWFLIGAWPVVWAILYVTPRVLG